MTAVAAIHEGVTFLSDGLRLEGVLAYPEESSAPDLAVLAPPHACLGGDMENNVILALEAALLARGVATLRHNVRGVGRSETHVPLEAQVAAFWEDPRIDSARETGLADLHAAVEFGLSALHPPRLFLVGYSFGGVMTLLEAARRDDVAGVAAISPPVHQLTTPLAWPGGIPAVVTRAGDDLGVEDEAHARLLAMLAPGVRAFAYPETDHFHRGCEQALAEAVAETLLG